MPPDQVRLHTLEIFLVGALAKTIATLTTYPFQVIKERMQAQNKLQGDHYSSIADCTTRMYQNEGLGVFYLGIDAKLSQTVSNASFSFVFYEHILNFLHYLLAAT